MQGRTKKARPVMVGRVGIAGKVGASASPLPVPNQPLVLPLLSLLLRVLPPLPALLLLLALPPIRASSDPGPATTAKSVGSAKRCEASPTNRASGSTSSTASYCVSPTARRRTQLAGVLFSHPQPRLQRLREQGETGKQVSIAGRP